MSFPSGDSSQNTPRYQQVLLIPAEEVVQRESHSIVLGPVRVDLDVNKMLRALLWPGGMVSAVGLAPGEDRGSSGRVLTSTGPFSCLRNHARATVE